VILAARKGRSVPERGGGPKVDKINTWNVGGDLPAMSHVQATPLVDGVINADRRPRRITGEVYLLAPSAQLQGSTLPTATSGVSITGDMGFVRFDKYRTGSPAPGLTG
jgi:hypothetical protein